MKDKNPHPMPPTRAILLKKERKIYKGAKSKPSKIKEKQNKNKKNEKKMALIEKVLHS